MLKANQFTKDINWDHLCVACSHAKITSTYNKCYGTLIVSIIRMLKYQKERKILSSMSIFEHFGLRRIFAFMHICVIMNKHTCLYRYLNRYKTNSVFRAWLVFNLNDGWESDLDQLITGNKSAMQ